MLAEKARYHRVKLGNQSVRCEETKKTGDYVSSESIMDDDFDFSQGEEQSSSDTDYAAHSPSQPWPTTITGGVKMEREVLDPEGELHVVPLLKYE